VWREGADTVAVAAAAVVVVDEAGWKSAGKEPAAEDAGPRPALFTLALKMGVVP
jgi:hypothetical protein